MSQVRNHIMPTARCATDRQTDGQC